MEVKQLRTIASEIFKTVNDMNPSFMKDLFNLSGHTLKRPNDAEVQVRYSTAISSINFLKLPIAIIILPGY